DSAGAGGGACVSVPACDGRGGLRGSNHELVFFGVLACVPCVLRVGCGRDGSSAPASRTPPVAPVPFPSGVFSAGGAGCADPRAELSMGSRTTIGGIGRDPGMLIRARVTVVST